MITSAGATPRCGVRGRRGGPGPGRSGPLHELIAVKSRRRAVGDSAANHASVLRPEAFEAPPVGWPCSDATGRRGRERLMSTGEKTYQGQCYCGAVRIVVTGDPAGVGYD